MFSFPTCQACDHHTDFQSHQTIYHFQASFGVSPVSEVPAGFDVF